MSQFSCTKKNESTWISASAGTGKTWSLTHRVLSLLVQNVHPEKILCITFTNNAAFEMQERITSGAIELLSLSHDDFLKRISYMYTLDAPLDYERATNSLLSILDNPGSIRIHTIHSFCLEIVQSHPFEIGIRPGFKIMNDLWTSKLIKQTLEQTTKELAAKNDPLIEIITTKFKDSRLIDEITKAISQADKFTRTNALMELRHNLHDLQRQIQDLRMQLIEIVDALCLTLQQENLNVESSAITKLMDWHQLDREQKNNDFELLQDIFLTKEGEIRKALLSKKFTEHHNLLTEEILKIQDLVSNLCKETGYLENSFYSEAMLVFLHKIVKNYCKLKHQMNMVSFDDIIQFAWSLLSKNEFSTWVLYKLDYKFDHVLIDEAQDTNHLQWGVIGKICDEFYNNTSASKADRSLFVVGDDKQSIFGFQGSDPDCFSYYAKHYKHKISEDPYKSFSSMELTKSFRSSKSIIHFINHFFGPLFQDGANTKNIHEAHHQTEGLVELWPLSLGNVESSAEKTLALEIANTISKWLVQKRMVISTNKVIEPNDIMILMRTRGTLYREIINALTEYNIPNSGEDKFEIKDHLFVKDILACAAFALLPEDDLTCATLMRSPLIDIDDQLLEDLCVNRDKPLYKLYKNRFLEDLILNKNMHPRDFFYKIIFAHEDKYLPYYGPSLKGIISQFNALIEEFEKNDIPNLQIFMEWIHKNDFQIKKTQDFQLNEVKIITTHSSKGLEAKIVIFPDTISREQENDRIIETEDSIYYSSNFWLEPEHVISERQKIEAKQKAENLRLLYVGLTRAENELYIMGASNRKNSPADCWYNLMEKSLAQIAQCYEGKYYLGDNRYQYSAIQKEQGSTIETTIAVRETISQRKSSNIAPSRGKSYEPISPYDKRYTKIELGRQLHSLIATYSYKQHTNPMILDCIKKLYPLAIAHTDFEILDAFFSTLKSSQIFNEVNFINIDRSDAEQYQYIYNGSIDMLVCDKKSVKIYEFKSSDNNLSHSGDLPAIYQNQIESYKAIVMKHFSTQKVEANIFWLTGSAALR
jgi:ATP-dependent helicase/nuclease subunit A